MSDMKVTELFGCMVFDDATMKEKLPKETYRLLQRTMKTASILIWQSPTSLPTP